GADGRSLLWHVPEPPLVDAPRAKRRGGADRFVRAGGLGLDRGRDAAGLLVVQIFRDAHATAPGWAPAPSAPPAICMMAPKAWGQSTLRGGGSVRQRTGRNAHHRAAGRHVMKYNGIGTDACSRAHPNLPDDLGAGADEDVIFQQG